MTTLTIEQEAEELGSKGDHVDMLPHVPTTPASDAPTDIGEHPDLRALAGLDRLTLSSPAVSGLSAAHRLEARKIGLATVGLSFHHSGLMNYTQGPLRWEGISRHETLHSGKVPRESDCSAWATWVEWNALCIPFGLRDVVNGENWTGGFTGTMLQHGKVVHHDENLKVLDLIVYNGHVAVYIGGGMVASHGSPGLHKLGMYYRSDVVSRRRVI